jgi:hypothetical protein
LSQFSGLIEPVMPCREQAAQALPRPPNGSLSRNTLIRNDL